MPTTITLDGVRRGGFFSRLRGDDRGQWLTGPRLGDAWSDDAASPAGGDNAVADFTTAAFGWGILAFAVGTAAIRGYGAVKRMIK